MKKKIIWGISGGIVFALFLTLLGISNHIGSSLPDQMMAKRWSKEGGVAQVSCFFSPNAKVTEDALREFEHSVDNFLKESSIYVESENPSARLWADAYSADGQIQLSNDKKSLNADAVGVGGDFFLFHPVKLIDGAYFSGNDVNKDYLLIDQDAAWQLFGSSNVAGMLVFISGQPHVVTGVIERQDDRMAKAAGLDGTLVYVSYETLDQYGSNNGINHYEIIMPSPVKNFALDYVKKQLGSNERETEVLENTTRFSLLNRLKIIGNFGTRSMNGKAIIYPYWENIARGYEDISAVITLFMILFLLYPAVLGIVLFALWWKHKGWTLKEVAVRGKDKAERYAERARAKRQARREENTEEAE